MNCQKGNIVALIAIGAAIIFASIAGLFFYQNQLLQQANTSLPAVQTPTKVDPTANWKTYNNSKHRYSFKYPADWILGDSPYSQVPDSTSDDIAFDGKPMDAMARFAVRVNAQPNCSDLKTCVIKNRIVFGDTQIESDEHTLTIADNQAIAETISRPSSGNWKYYIWYILKDHKLYTIFTISLESDDKITKPVYDQILSTFKFTDQGISNSPKTNQSNTTIENAQKSQFGSITVHLGNATSSNCTNPFNVTCYDESLDYPIVDQNLKVTIHSQATNEDQTKNGLSDSLFDNLNTGEYFVYVTNTINNPIKYLPRLMECGVNNSVCFAYGSESGQMCGTLIKLKSQMNVKFVCKFNSYKYNTQNAVEPVFPN